MKHIAIYTRVSTNKIEQKSSIENQDTLLKKLEKGNELYIYTDTKTGTSFKREGFQKMMYDAGLNLKKLKDGRITFEADDEREPKFNEIVVTSISRFGRNMAIVELLRVLWNYKKVNVKFTDINRNSSNADDMVMIQMFCVWAENEVTETAKRTKRGYEVSVMNNKIKNNSIYGWNFDRENNTLLINEDEAKGVRFIYNAILKNGLARTAKLTNESGFKTKKGNQWTASTIKTLITNPKYKGYNVRNKYENINLFTNSKTKYVKKENWTVMYNERIEAIVSEQIWATAQEAIESRKRNGNNGINQRKYDVSGIVKCNVCGGNYIKAIESKTNIEGKFRSYMICGCKKSKGKKYCDSKNIDFKHIEDYVEKQRREYKAKVHLAEKFKFISLKNKMKKELEGIHEVTKKDEEKLQAKKKGLKNKLVTIVDKFMVEDNEFIESTLTKKVLILEEEIRNIDKKLSHLDEKERLSSNEKYKREMKLLQKSIKEYKYGETEREEWLSRVEGLYVIDKTNLEVKYL